MTTDFRALCAELADELTQFNAWYIEDNGYGLPALEALLRRSDAALAQSDELAVPEGREPAKTELRQVFDDHSGYINDEQVMWWGDFHAAARRPKPPSLAEEALKALQDQIDTSFKISSEAQERANTIRAALERLKELEQLSDDQG